MQKIKKKKEKAKRNKHQNPNTKNQLNRNRQNDIKVIKITIFTDQVKGAIKFSGCLGALESPSWVGTWI